ncbi:MAG: DUF447 family protein [Desulfobacteraceae bacterium]|jgi:hypothetical protein
MSSLSGLGLNKNWTYETIITCFNGDIPHAAPFGIKSPDLETIQFEMYKGSNTLSVILDKREFAVNFIDDPAYFFNSLYDEDQLSFMEAKNVKAPVITDCPAFIEAKMTGSKEKSQSYIVDAEIVNISVNSTSRLFNRAEGLVIESLIISTRIEYMTDGKAEEILKENHRIIKKVAPDSQHVDIMEKLLNKCLILR